MAIPFIEDAYIDEIIKSAGSYNPSLTTTQGVKLRELIKLIRDRIEQGGTGEDIARFNPIAGVGVTLSGTYPDITFNAVDSGTAVSTLQQVTTVKNVTNRGIQFTGFAGTDLTSPGLHINSDLTGITGTGSIQFVSNPLSGTIGNQEGKILFGNDYIEISSGGGNPISFSMSGTNSSALPRVVFSGRVAGGEATASNEFTTMNQLPTFVAGSNITVTPTTVGSRIQYTIAVSNGGGGGTASSVTSANSDIDVVTTTSTSLLTLNSGTGANQIVKRDANGAIVGYAKLAGGNTFTGTQNFSGPINAVSGLAVTQGSLSSVGTIGVNRTAGGLNNIALLGWNNPDANTESGYLSLANFNKTSGQLVSGINLAQNPAASGFINVTYPATSGTLALKSDIISPDFSQYAKLVGGNNLTGIQKITDGFGFIANSFSQTSANNLNALNIVASSTSTSAATGTIQFKQYNLAGTNSLQTSLMQSPNHPGTTTVYLPSANGTLARIEDLGAYAVVNGGNTFNGAQKFQQIAYYDTARDLEYTRLTRTINGTDYTAGAVIFTKNNVDSTGTRYSAVLTLSSNYTGLRDETGQSFFTLPDRIGQLALKSDITSVLVSETLQAVTARGKTITRAGGATSLNGTADFVLDGNSPGTAGDVYLNAYNTGKVILALGGGNVGIGTTTPSQKLAIGGGDIGIQQIGSGIVIPSPDGSYWRITVSNSGSLITAKL